MFSLRRRIASSGSLHLWKKETRMVVAPFSSSSSSSTENDASIEIPVTAFRKRSRPFVNKSCIFGKLQPFVGETLDFITREEEKKGVYVTKEDLVDWAKQLNKDGKFEYAFEIFEWMDKKKKMEFSPSELAFYVDLICQTKSIPAAKEYFNQVEPVFNTTNTRAKNWPAFLSIMLRVFEYTRKHHKGQLRPLYYGRDRPPGPPSL